VTKLCARKDLKLVHLQNGKVAKPKVVYMSTPKDVKSIYKSIIELKMSDGYESSIARCLNHDKGSMHSMKSHDSHVFMECLLPIAFWSFPQFVWSALAKISQFFKDL